MNTIASGRYGTNRKRNRATPIISRPNSFYSHLIISASFGEENRLPQIYLQRNNTYYFHHEMPRRRFRRMLTFSAHRTFCRSQISAVRSFLSADKDIAPGLNSCSWFHQCELSCSSVALLLASCTTVGLHHALTSEEKC